MKYIYIYIYIYVNHNKETYLIIKPTHIYIPYTCVYRTQLCDSLYSTISIIASIIASTAVIAVIYNSNTIVYYSSSL